MGVQPMYSTHRRIMGDEKLRLMKKSPILADVYKLKMGELDSIHCWGNVLA